MSELVDKLRQGDRRAMARAMSRVDPTGRTDPALEVCLRQLTGQIPWWGFTGPPGVGKSTLIDALLVRLRERGHRIGVLAIDPSSPRSNGALLGDRVRMMRHALDTDVFIRSLATRGHEGGLSDTTVHCARLMELAGYDPVLIETVGVGQNELEIASVADVCVVVLGPGHGDDIQLIKAGLLEIADIVVVNKCDLPESHRLIKEVREELTGAALTRGGGRFDPLAESESDSSAGGPEVVELEAKSGRGVENLLERLLELDRARRTPEALACRDERRVLDEIRRGAMAACGRSVERMLTGSAAKQWIAKLNRGESTLDTVISQLAASALAEVQQVASDD